MAVSKSKLARSKKKIWSRQYCNYLEQKNYLINKPAKKPLIKLRKKSRLPFWKQAELHLRCSVLSGI